MQLMPRQNGCVRCDTNAKLSCPTECGEGTECGYEILLDCQSCPQAICVPSANPSSSGTTDASNSTQDNGPNVGAIAGGVVGGVALVAAATYLLWRFCIKPKRTAEAPSIYVEDVDRDAITEKDFASRRDQRSSMHTVHSVASTVLTRASNIIQIAYIPGVTNRAPPSSPTVLVPPVPPIPVNFVQGNNGGSIPSTPTTPYEDQHFFIPGTLRDSTYSGFSGASDRTSYARTSYAPRSSIASTVYGKNVTIQAPAQTGMRAKPTVVSVSVRSTENSTDGLDTPPVPSIDFDKFGRPTSAMSTFSVGSTFLSNASTAAQGRAQVVKVANIKKVNSPTPSASERLAPLSPGAQSTATVSSLSSDDTGSPEQSPFSDPDERPSSLNLAIEDATRRAAKVKTKRTSSALRETSPFGDEHATRD